MQISEKANYPIFNLLNKNIWGGSGANKTILPVLLWKECKVCKKYFRYVRMYYESHSGRSIVGDYSYRIYCCPICANNSIKAKYLLGIN